MKIGVVGDDEFVTGFKLAGVDRAYVVKDSLAKKFEEAVNDEETGIIIIHDEDMKKLPHSMVKNLDKMTRPVVITVSGTESGSDLKKLIKRCIGIELG